MYIITFHYYFYSLYMKKIMPFSKFSSVLSSIGKSRVLFEAQSYTKLDRSKFNRSKLGLSKFCYSKCSRWIVFTQRLTFLHVKVSRSLFGREHYDQQQPPEISLPDPPGELPQLPQLQPLSDLVSKNGLIDTDPQSAVKSRPYDGDADSGIGITIIRYLYISTGSQTKK